jgi:hypothetical protein
MEDGTMEAVHRLSAQQQLKSFVVAPFEPKLALKITFPCSLQLKRFSLSMVAHFRELLVGRTQYILEGYVALLYDWLSLFAWINIISSATRHQLFSFMTECIIIRLVIPTFRFFGLKYQFVLLEYPVYELL